MAVGAKYDLKRLGGCLLTPDWVIFLTLPKPHNPSPNFSIFIVVKGTVTGTKAEWVAAERVMILMLP